MTCLIASINCEVVCKCFTCKKLLLSMYCCMLYFLRKIIVKYFKLNAPIFGQADYCIRSAYSGELYSTTEKWALYLTPYYLFYDPRCDEYKLMCCPVVLI